jgi:hypothetical protein
MGLKRGPLSLVSTIEELLERKSSGSGVESRITAIGIRYADHVASSICKSWHYRRRQAAVARGLRPRSLGVAAENRH